ncbi:MAG: rhamnulokinase family protein [Akkermansiaceae bacterium]
MNQVYLAIDLGAGSGRVIAGVVNVSESGQVDDQSTLKLEELHRFENRGCELPGGYFWNIIGIYENILEGLRIGIEKFGNDVVAIGIDTWGCDYGLISSNGNLLGIPHQYRDPRSEGMDTEADKLIGQDKIYASTGIMPAFYNTSGQLLAQVKNGSSALTEADSLLFIPDLLAYFLTGEKGNEQTVASTSQLFNPEKMDWAWNIIDALGIPRDIFCRIIKPGQTIGKLRPELTRKLGAGEISVVAAPSHDTASAVAGIPIGSVTGSDDGRDVWISSGTWSIMGIESPRPIMTEAARAAGFANEVGVEDSVRFLKNISGLWMIQECRRQWTEEGTQLSYAELAELALAAEAFTAFVDPDDPVFSSPGDMPNKIVDYCEKTGQSVPTNKGTILRIVSESIAMKYRVVYDSLGDVLGEKLGKVYMGGGGIQNELLTQNASDAIGQVIVAGPIEATSCGNLITQMVATGALMDTASGRALIERSNAMQTYQPKNMALWQEQLLRFQEVIAP